jgi:hypothetical protein
MRLSDPLGVDNYPSVAMIIPSLQTIRLMSELKGRVHLSSLTATLYKTYQRHTFRCLHAGDILLNYQAQLISGV